MSAGTPGYSLTKIHTQIGPMIGSSIDNRATSVAGARAAPMLNSVRPMYYCELQDIYGRMPFGLRNYWSGRFLRDLPDDAIEHVVGTFNDAEAMGDVLLERIHGAATRVPPEATAFAGREAAYNATFIGTWTDAAEDEHWIGVARSFSAALAPWTIGGAYLNYAFEASSEDLEAEFGAQRLERLRAVKRGFDPENVFRFNHNIAPR